MTQAAVLLTYTEIRAYILNKESEKERDREREKERDQNIVDLKTT